MRNVAARASLPVPPGVAPRAVLYFVGDQLPASIPDDIRALQDPQWQLELLRGKFPHAHSFFVIFPARLEDGFAAYDQFLRQTTRYGEPAMGYSSTPVVALRELFAILDECSEWGDAVAAASPDCTPRIELAAFSKGCVVLNQVFAEMSQMSAQLSSSMNSSRGSSAEPSPLRQRSPIAGGTAATAAAMTSNRSPYARVRSLHHSRSPSSSSDADRGNDGDQSLSIPSACPRAALTLEEMHAQETCLVSRAHEQIKALHYIDGGLNTRGAFIMHPRMLNAFSAAQEEHVRASGHGRADDADDPVKITLMTTWRQVEDAHRPWITEEVQKFIFFARNAKPRPIRIARLHLPKPESTPNDTLVGLRVHMSSQEMFCPTLEQDRLVEK